MEILQELLRKVLINFQDVKLCIVFGSAASDKATPQSDLDIAVAGDRPLTGEKLLELVEAFTEATNREIDLIDLATATGLILKQALSTGVVIQNLDKTLYARLISRMLFNEADMMPYFHRTLQEPRKRFLDGQRSN
ncbi:MAG: nucleotidyltransferase domain-containing protein [Acidobacteriota bacterium]|jgi:predicted nucleotidyltransferase